MTFVGRAEVLHFHQLELTRPEDLVAGGDLVAEGLADLGDAEGKLASRRALDMREVDEHALRRLGAEVDDGGVVLDRAHVGLEHQVELAGVGEGALLPAVGARVRVLQVVGPEAVVAVAALDQRVVERLEVP